MNRVNSASPQPLLVFWKLFRLCSVSTVLGSRNRVSWWFTLHWSVMLSLTLAMRFSAKTYFRFRDWEIITSSSDVIVYWLLNMSSHRTLNFSVCQYLSYGGGAYFHCDLREIRKAHKFNNSSQVFVGIGAIFLQGQEPLRMDALQCRRRPLSFKKLRNRHKTASVKMGYLLHAHLKLLSLLRTEN